MEKRRRTIAHYEGKVILILNLQLFVLVYPIFLGKFNFMKYQFSMPDRVPGHPNATSELQALFEQVNAIFDVL